MTPEEVQGRRFTLAIAMWLFMVPTIFLLLVVAFSHRPSTPGWASFAVTATANLGFGWLLYRAYRWTRIYIALVLLLTALIPIGRTVLLARGFTAPMQYAIAASMLVPSFVNLFIAVALWRSSSIAAYFDRENALASLNLST